MSERSQMKAHIVAPVVLTALGVSVGARADLFTFDPTGTPGAAGNITNAALIDQTPGSALAVGGSTAITNFLSGSGSTKFTLYYQANLSAVQDENTLNLFSNGAGGKFFTFVAGFGESVTSVAANGSATFAFDPTNPVNFFTMYATNALGNNLTGNGFATGTPILSGHLLAIPTSNFVISSTTPVNFDQSPNGNQWSTQKTVTGAGSSDITIVVDLVNTNYFPSLDPLSHMFVSFFNTSQVDPFKQVDPSKCFNTHSGTCNAGTGLISTGTLGAVNGKVGSGPNFEFQADANQSITVPEPGTVGLLGLGLAILGLAGSRRRPR